MSVSYLSNYYKISEAVGLTLLGCKNGLTVLCLNGRHEVIANAGNDSSRFTLTFLKKDKSETERSSNDNNSNNNNNNNNSDNNSNNGGGGSSDSSGNTANPITTLPPPQSTEIEVIYRTNSDGSVVTQTTTTRIAETAALSSADTQSSGMTIKTRNTIIGVVVGVGGGVIIGALGLVAFRIWGRQKQADEAGGLMDYGTDMNAVEKSPRGSSAGGQRNPFQSTLENYHQPTPVNASSNF